MSELIRKATKEASRLRDLLDDFHEWSKEPCSCGSQRRLCVTCERPLPDKFAVLNPRPSADDGEREQAAKVCETRATMLDNDAKRYWVGSGARKLLEDDAAALRLAAQSLRAGAVDEGMDEKIRVALSAFNRADGNNADKMRAALNAALGRRE